MQLRASVENMMSLPPSVSVTSLVARLGGPSSSPVVLSHAACGRGSPLVNSALGWKKSRLTAPLQAWNDVRG